MTLHWLIPPVCFTRLFAMSGSVISTSELEAIRRRAFIGKLVVNAETQALSSEADRRKRLKELSNARSKRWPNTLAAQRRAKANARALREEQEEAARRVLDQQEEQRRARERLATIKRANDKLQAQTDRMKMLKSQRLLSDVIDVRARGCGCTLVVASPSPQRGWHTGRPAHSK